MSENHPFSASIVMPFYTKWELCQARLYEMRIHLLGRHDVEILLVDDHSPDPEIYLGNIAWWKKTLDDTTYSKLRYSRCPENVGFGMAMNFGAAKAKTDVIVLFSNDVIIKGDFLDCIFKAIDEHPNALIGAEMIDWDSGWNMIDGKVMKYLNGWLLACSKAVWLDIGGFDPRFGKFDCEDMDLSTTARSKGHELISFKKQFVYHLGAQTIVTVAPNRMEITKSNVKLFQEKWTGKVGNL